MKSGLRLGIGAGSFLIGLLLLGFGMSRVVWSASPSHSVVWHEPLGWSALTLAGVVLVCSAGVWWQFLAGYILVGCLKSMIALITGRDLFAPYEPIARIQSAKLAAFCVATLVLMFRFSKSQPTMFDRIALTVYLFCLMWSLHGAVFSVSGRGLIVALFALLISWCVNQWREHKSCPGSRNSSFD